MPDISVAPAAPVAPAAAITGSATPVKDGAAVDADAFASQLSAALQALGVPADAAATMTDAKLTLALEGQQSETTDELTDEVAAELLASLGILPLPVAPAAPLVHLEHAETSTASHTAVDVQAGASAASLTLAATAPLGTVVAQPQPTESVVAPSAARVEPANADAAPMVPATADIASPALPNQPELEVDARMLESLRTDSTAAPAVQPQQQATDAPAMTNGQNATTHLTTPTDAQPALSTASSVAPAVPMQSGLDHGATGDQHGDTATETGATDGVDTRSEAPAFAPSVAASRVAEPQTPQTSPTHVVNQIAQQADLYRLPGGRGVRIELNPEGLGGVQVTVRYAPTGEVELHMNVQHAATADLVQAGWGELRDALTAQGIAPERLVMSITSSAAGSGLSDGSAQGNGSAFRSDGGQNSFGQQGQTGQRDAQPESRAWNGRFDGAATPDEQQLNAATSRIDLRA